MYCQNYVKPYVPYDPYVAQKSGYKIFSIKSRQFSKEKGNKKNENIHMKILYFSFLKNEEPNA
jgi:hypothetical protein